MRPYAVAIACFLTFQHATKYPKPLLGTWGTRDTRAAVKVTSWTPATWATCSPGLCHLTPAGHWTDNWCSTGSCWVANHRLVCTELILLLMMSFTLHDLETCNKIFRPFVVHEIWYDLIWFLTTSLFVGDVCLCCILCSLPVYISHLALETETHKRHEVNRGRQRSSFRSLQVTRYKIMIIVKTSSSEKNCFTTEQQNSGPLEC